MKSPLRGIAVLLIMVLLPAMSVATDKQRLETEREQVSYMVGMDIAKSLTPMAPDLDLDSLERALSNAMEGGQQLLGEKEAAATSQALKQSLAFRSGQPVAGIPPGAQPAAPDKSRVGLMLGADIARSLTPLKSELDMPVVMQAIRTALAGQPLLLTNSEADVLRSSFNERMQIRLQAETGKSAAANAAEGQAFLAKNKLVKGVFTTPSGLQYQVLRQGSGKRPLPSDHVRVNYKGSLLNGEVFDSSYDRGEPAEFGLNQVIAGWTEGLGLMPVGAKYRLWIPGELAYGPKGTQGIGPNSTLVFDVELLDVL